MPRNSRDLYVTIKNRMATTRSSFPNASTVAEFRPHSQTIHLHNIDKESYYSDLLAKRYSNIRRDIETIIHELTHWTDLVGTVWGQEYLIGLSNSFFALGHSEDTYWNVIELFDEDRRINLPRYYRVIQDEPHPHNRQRPWRLDISCGFEFSPDGRLNENRPLLFVRFGANPSGDLVARQPITVGTLLELCAVYSEMATAQEIFKLITDEERAVELHLWRSEKESMLYDRNMTTYTAAAHLFAVWVGTHNMDITYRYAASLANIALNMTDEHFDLIKHPNIFSKFGNRVEAFTSSRNRGYAFAALAKNAPQYSGSSNLPDWLEETVRCSGLPDVEKIYADARNKIDGIAVADNRCRQNIRLSYLREFGLSVFDKRRMMEEAPALSVGSIVYHKMALPPMFDCNGDLFEFINDQDMRIDRQRYDALEAFENEWALREFRDNFLKGCRGIGRLERDE